MIETDLPISKWPIDESSQPSRIPKSELSYYKLSRIIEALNDRLGRAWSSV